jgi:hypothetical protein
MSRKRHRKEPCPCAECNGDLRDTRTKKRHVYKEQQAQQVLQEMGEVALPELERDEENNEEMLNDESEAKSASDEMETTHQILELPDVCSPIFPTDPESTLTVGCVVMLVCDWWVANKASIRATSHIWRFTRTLLGRENMLPAFPIVKKLLKKHRLESMRKVCTRCCIPRVAYIALNRHYIYI